MLHMLEKLKIRTEFVTALSQQNVLSDFCLGKAKMAKTSQLGCFDKMVLLSRLFHVKDR